MKIRSGWYGRGRAGKGGTFAEDFIEGNCVSSGFPNAGEVSLGSEPAELVRSVVDDTDREELIDSIDDQSNELLEDRIAGLDWEQM